MLNQLFFLQISFVSINSIIFLAIIHFFFEIINVAQPQIILHNLVILKLDPEIVNIMIMLSCYVIVYYMKIKFIDKKEMLQNNFIKQYQRRFAPFLPLFLRFFFAFSSSKN